MSEDKEPYIRSKIAVKVLNFLQGKEEGGYSTQIAEELDKSQSSISAILGELENKGLVKKGKRTRAQFYEIDYSGMADYWYNKLEASLESSNEFFNEEILSEFKEKDKETKSFAQKYFKAVLITSDDDLTLYELLFTSFAFSLARYRAKSYYETEYFDGEDSFSRYFAVTLFALVSFIDLPDYSPVISAVERLDEDMGFSEALEDIEEENKESGASE